MNNSYQSLPCEKLTARTETGENVRIAFDSHDRYRLTKQMSTKCCSTILEIGTEIEVVKRLSENRILVKSGEQYHKIKLSTFSVSAIRLADI